MRAVYKHIPAQRIVLDNINKIYIFLFSRGLMS